MKKYIIILFACAAFHTSLIAQRLGTEEAESFLAVNDYYNAIPVLEKLAKFKGADKWKCKLAYSYYMTKNMKMALDTYESMDTITDPSCVFHYALTLLCTERYEEAIRWAGLIHNEKEYSSASDQIILCAGYALRHTESNGWDVRKNEYFPEGIYTGGGLHNRQMYFGFEKYEDGYITSNVYVSSADNFFTEFSSFEKMVHSKYFIGGISFSQMNQTVVYSVQDSESSRTNDKRLSKDHISTNYVNTLNLYYGEFDGQGIQHTESFGFNSKEYSCMHPSLNEQGDVCYFSSNMPGGYGGFDIYRIQKVNDTWSTPVNMGERVNTSGDEMYPFILKDSILFFSSNGFAGFGGSDIYKLHLTGRHSKSAVNLGRPVNSGMDDFGVGFITEHSGYFFSNRESSAGTDDLFTFEMPEEVDFDTTQGFILDALTREPLINARILIIKEDSTVASLSTDSNGVFKFTQMLPNESYIIKANKDRYHEKQMGVVSVETGVINIEMELDPVIALNSIFTLHNILFEYNDYRLTPESMKILDKVAEIIMKNANTKFELSAHTDSRGNDSDNLILSKQRAQAAVYYLLSKGVNPDQLVAVGYGEKYIKNHCGNDSRCSENEHAVNRRVEIKVISVK